jgi:hypothetical protein
MQEFGQKKYLPISEQVNSIKSVVPYPMQLLYAKL